MVGIASTPGDPAAPLLGSSPISTQYLSSGSQVYALGLLDLC